MRKVERKFTKAQIFTIWLLIASLLLAAAYVTVILVVNKLAGESQSKPQSTLLEPLEGESTYLNQLVAYPTVEESEITYIELENEYGRFGVSRYPNDLGNFLFHYYVDGQKNSIPYTPPICNAEGDFNYESLYAIETGDGYGMIYYLTYLCSALGAPYFSERIELPEEEAKRTALLREYGLTQSELTSVSFLCGERDKSTGHIIEESEKAYTLLIGDKALSGNGYYFMVGEEKEDGNIHLRDYVYYTSSEYFSYALAGFHEFVKGRLVAEGLEGESVYGPYLTTDFKKWTTLLYSEESDRVFTNDEAGYEHLDNPNVVVGGSHFTSIDRGLGYEPDPEELEEYNGYEIITDTSFSFDLELLESHPEYERILKALKGRTVGSYEGREILITLLTDLQNSTEKNVSFGESASVKYKYDILKIESVIDSDGERTEGVTTSSDTLFKLTYRYTVGGQTSKHDVHAVIDTADLAPAEASKLVGLEIGAQLTGVSLDVEYTKDNAKKLEEEYVLTGITAIFDENALLINKVEEDSSVSITYYRKVNGVRGETQTMVVDLSAIKDTDKIAPLKTILVGKGKGSLNEKVYSDTYYYEYMRDFVTYEIDRIKYFVTNEIVVSFRFENASERDPFYADTFFKNTLTNENSIYGLNAGSCETAVKLLGGIGTDSNSAVGLSGETVAVGLTLENMEKYGLYAHKIYFEMPRGIYDETEESGTSSSDNLSDFGWLSTLGFTLYISDDKYDEDGKRIRYIGSDMYDLIAKVPADDFDFLEYGFTEFWARRNLVMMDITKLTNLKLEFNMQDLQGEYDFEIIFKDMYGGYVGEDYVIKDDPFEGASPIENEIVRVKASDDAFNTAFKEKFGTAWGDLSSLYNDTMGGGKTTYYPGSNDTLGAAYFNSVYETLQLTRYLDLLTEEEQAQAFTKTRILRMQLKVEGKEYYYVYDFYRLDDRRIMVSLYRADENGNKIDRFGEVSDYYVSTFAFKKLVNHYVYLLNGKPVDESVNYN